MTPAGYERPVLPWLYAIGSYALVAGLVVLLSHTVHTARLESGHVPAGECDRIAAELEALKEETPPRRTPSFERFVTRYVQDPRVLCCPEIDPHRSAEYWPACAHTDEDMSYCYVSGLSTKARGTWIVAYDEHFNHLERGVNVLCVDGHVEWRDDVDEVERGVTKQLESRRLKRSGAAVCPPWWSRPGERPPFLTARPADERSSIWPVIAGSLALGAGVVVFGRLARSSWSSVESAGRR